MDLGSLLGSIFAVGFLVTAILIAVEFDFAMAAVYVDGAAVMITVGGSVGALLWALPIDRTLTGFKSISKTFSPPDLNARGAIENIIRLSNLARRESLLALEEPVRDMGDPFLQKGIMLVVDGADPELVRNVLETEISYIESRHAGVRGMWEFWGMMAPAWGMLGTLIGLINMLNQLDDPAALGPAMSIAIVTTFYGSLIANAFCLPIANKLRIFSNDELLVKEVLIEGILSIQAGDNPRIIEEKLKSFLSPALREDKNDQDVAA